MLCWEDMIALISMFEVLLFLMSIWTFILNHLDLNIHAKIKKITLRIMLGSIPHQKNCFYHLPTRGRTGTKLGDAWYVSNVSINFDCSMLLYYPFWYLWALLYIFISIFGTNLLTGGPARIAVFCLFQYFKEKEYQTESKWNETFGSVIFGTNVIQRTWSESQEAVEAATRVEDAPTHTGRAPYLVGPSGSHRPTSSSYIYPRTPRTSKQAMKT